MFQIYVEPVRQSCGDMEHQVRKISTVTDAVEDVMNNLKRMSGYEEVIMACRKEIERMDTEEVKYRQMTKALTDAVLYYQTHENRIIQNAELGIMANRVRRVGISKVDKSVVSNWNIKLV